MNTIGILTSGGDSPGMNACIAAIVRESRRRNMKPVGILRGFEGLAAGSTIELDENAVSGISGRGGSILRTSRSNTSGSLVPEGDLEGMFGAIGIDALLVLGGEGSIGAAKQVSDMGAPIVAVPCTIDNDVEGTEYTIGFDSACNHVVRAADSIVDTGESLEGRVFLIETLGGESGHIAVASAHAIGADAVFVPELKPNVKAVCSRLREEMDGGKTYAIIVIGEGAGPAQSFAHPIAEMLGRRVRVTMIGHAQRGGSPTYWDRKVARDFGEMAVRLLVDGESGVMTAMQSGTLVDVSLSIAAGDEKEFDLQTYMMVNRLG